MNTQLNRLADEIKFENKGGPVSLTYAEALAAAAIAGGLPASIDAIATSYQRARAACEEQGHPELAHHAGIAAVVTHSMGANTLADEIERVQLAAVWISAALAALVRLRGGKLTITREDMEACHGLGLYELAEHNPDRVTFSLKDMPT